MSIRSTEKKNKAYSFRIAPELKGLMEQEAQSCGLSLSSWIKMLASKELKKQGYELPTKK